MLFCNSRKFAQLFNHDIAVGLGVFPLRDEKAEHTDIAAVQQLADAAQALQLLQLHGKARLVFYPHLADG